MTKPVILTGLRANNNLTIGNYFGGMLPLIDMAQSKASEYQINMFIPDLHSFTTPIDHTSLYDQIFHTAKVFAAAGLPLDDERINMYRQSYIPAHSELTWILDCFTGFGEMSRMTQFKDKSGNIGTDRTTVGLFNYPVLMAADILLYGAKYIPVGDDQTQHLEFTRDIAERLNTRFGELFVIPESVKKQHEFFGKDQGLRIMDLADPTKKMSKSDNSGKGVIYLSDAPEVAAKKIMSATTDDKALVKFNPSSQPGISNLIEILALLKGEPVSVTAGRYEGETKYGVFKQAVAHEVQAFLTDFQSKLSAVSDDDVASALERSEATMATQASLRLLAVQKAVGLRPRTQVE
ncbi:MAG: tryptophan--tRNA ligase [Candidatus Saccharimonadales bacterium]